jgi:hypothetical protein
MPLDLINMKDPLVKDVDPEKLHAFDPDKAAANLGYTARKFSQAQLFCAHALVKLWYKEMSGAHLLNDERFEAAAKALREYEPKQIANAIRAYGQHCRTAKARIATPEMRLTFERFMKSLETWIVVGNKQTAIAVKQQATIEQLHTAQPILARYYALSQAEQHRILKEAIYMLDTRGGDYGTPVISNPKVLAAIGEILNQRSSHRGTEAQRSEALHA